MKYTVIGHICKDYIHSKKSGKSDNVEPMWGGIFFSVAALANVASPDDTIIPVFSVGESDYDELIDRLKKYPNVETAGIFKSAAETNSVHLTYSSSQTRAECSAHIALPIPFKKIQPFLKTNALLVNMVSGFDITLETLDYIRLDIREKDILSHIDFHSLTLGINDDNTRFRSPLIEWRRWAFMLNNVQMNQEEAKSMTVERFNEDVLAMQLLSLDVQAMLITKGAKGVSVFTLDDHKKFYRNDIAPPEKIKAIDTTGCGDVFSAAYLYQLSKTKNILEAAEFANRVAILNAQYAGSSEIDTLGTLLQQTQPIKEEMTP